MEISNVLNIFNTGYEIQLILNEELLFSKKVDTRIFIGKLSFTTETVCVHYKYPSSSKGESSLYIEYYKIEKNEIVTSKEYVFPFGYSCNNLEFKICKVDTEHYNIILGDLTNFNTINVVSVTPELCFDPYQLDCSSIDKMYVIDRDTLLYAYVCIIQTKLCISIINEKTNKVIYQLVTMSPDNNTYKEIDSYLLDFSNDNCVIQLWIESDYELVASINMKNDKVEFVTQF